MWSYNLVMKWARDLLFGTSSTDFRKQHHAAGPAQLAEANRASTSPASRVNLTRLPDHWLKHNITMVFTPDGIEGNSTHAWIGVVDMLAYDLPKVMRDGLYWSEANLDRELCYITDDPSSVLGFQNSLQDTSARVFIFRDTSREDPLWTAQLTVFCRSVATAANFKFGDLTVEQISDCAARNKDGRHVYSYSSTHTTCNFNTIYDDMPLDGWWPWPKRLDEGNRDLMLV